VERSIVIAGFGGQGILFTGHVLAEAAMLDGLETLWIPSYGPEMRGGTASCTVIVGDEPIGSPVVDLADAVIVMNPPSLERFAPTVAPGGLLIVNATLVSGDAARTDLEELRLPCLELAGPEADERLASVVALGALVERLELVTVTSIRAAIRSIVGDRRPAIIDADLGAFDAGRAAVRERAAERRLLATV
jgi:2-oxoglutarate ferredoxin oxidoreductase subunit gamma